MKISFIKIFAILISFMAPALVYASCFDDLGPVDNNSARFHIEEAVKHAAGLTEGGRRIAKLNEETSKIKGFPDLRKRIRELEISTKKMLEHAEETIKAINSAIGTSGITKEARGHGEEALSRINAAINNLKATLNATRDAQAVSDYNKAMEITTEGIRHAERAGTLAEEGYSEIKKM